MTCEIGACALSSFPILPGKYGDGVVWQRGMLQGQPNAGTHFARSAAADRVHNEHGGSWLCDCGVHIGGGAHFLNAGAA